MRLVMVQLLMNLRPELGARENNKSPVLSVEARQRLNHCFKQLFLSFRGEPMLRVVLLNLVAFTKVFSGIHNR